MSTAETEGGGQLEPLAHDPVVTERAWAEPWKGPFLEAIARMPNIAAACRLVGIHYDTQKWARRHDDEFRIAFEEARSIGVDFLEQVAHRRATVGQKVVVVRTRIKRDHEGKIIEEERTETEDLRIDNQLLMFLLKAYRPEVYRERLDLRHSLNPDDHEPPAEDEVYRTPTRERMLELAELAQKLELPVIEGEGRRIEPSTNGDQPHESDE